MNPVENKTVRDCIIIFMRTPELGKVKTRLSGGLPPESILDLYKCFVADILDTANKSGTPIRIYYHPPGSAPDLLKFPGRQYRYFPQQGNDLGERMAAAFREGFSDGYDRIVLIGTDCPELTGTILGEAFSGIGNSGCVIGPAADGGYYLIGFDRTVFSEKPFLDIVWGTGTVFEETMETCRRSGIQPCILPRLNDIDRMEDLVSFHRNYQNTKSSAPRTMDFITRNRLLDGFT